MAFSVRIAIYQIDFLIPYSGRVIKGMCKFFEIINSRVSFMSSLMSSKHIFPAFKDQWLEEQWCYRHHVSAFSTTHVEFGHLFMGPLNVRTRYVTPWIADSFVIIEIVGQEPKKVDGLRLLNCCPRTKMGLYVWPTWRRSFPCLAGLLSQPNNGLVGNRDGQVSYRNAKSFQGFVDNETKFPTLWTCEMKWK